MIIDNKLVIKDLFLNFENKDKISNDERQATLNSLKFLNDWIETLETSKEHMSNELNCINQYQNTDIKEEEH